MVTLQVTIGAASTAATTLDLYASTLVMTCSGTDYFGGVGVTSSNGIKLPTATPVVIPTSAPHGIALKNLYFAGAQNDTVNIAYEPAQ